MIQSLGRLSGNVLTLVLVMAGSNALAGTSTSAIIQSAPTLSEWGLITLSSLLALGGIFILRRHLNK